MSTELVERLRAMAAQTRDCTVCDGDVTDLAIYIIGMGCVGAVLLAIGLWP